VGGGHAEGREGRAVHRELLLVIRKQGEWPQGRHRRGGENSEEQSSSGRALRRLHLAEPLAPKLHRHAAAAASLRAAPSRAASATARCASARASALCRSPSWAGPPGLGLASRSARPRLDRWLSRTRSAQPSHRQPARLQLPPLAAASRASQRRPAPGLNRASARSCR
jgi:hypothetical protein